MFDPTYAPDVDVPEFPVTCPGCGGSGSGDPALGDHYFGVVEPGSIPPCDRCNGDGVVAGLAPPVSDQVRLELIGGNWWWGAGPPRLPIAESLDVALGWCARLSPGAREWIEVGW